MILSIDASTKSTGWALYNGKKLVDFGCIKASGADMIKRVYKITDGIEEILNKWDVDTICMEQVFIERGKQTATYTALMYLQANLRFLLHDKFPSVEIEFMLPNVWRKQLMITQGRGVKRDVLKVQDIEKANSLYGINLDNDDIADAILIGHAHVHKNDEEEFAW